MRLSRNHIQKDELCLTYLASMQQWRRVIYSFEGTLLEVDLTPIGASPPAGHRPATVLPSAWNYVARGRIRRTSASRGPGDKTYRYVKPDALFLAQLVALMGTNMPLTQTGDLLYKDYMSEIDWQKWKSMPKGHPVYFNEVKK